MKKYITILTIYLILFIFITFSIGVLMKIKRVSLIGGSTDAWLNYYSSILGTTLVVMGTYLISNRELTIEKEKKIKANEAKIRCVTSEVEIGDVFIPQTIINEDLHSSFYSNSNIKILNLGRNTITDIKYYFEILNFDQIISYIEENDLNQYTSNSIRKLSLSESDGRYKLKMKDFEGYFEKDIKKEKYLEYILPNNEANLYLPLNIIYLQIYRTCFYFLWIFKSSVEKISKDIKIPELVVKLNIEYTDHLGVVKNQTILYKVTTSAYGKNDSVNKRNEDMQLISHIVFEPQAK
ncbi:hypothetical protein ACVRZD_07505 [Streptococcus hongkongensis]|nr:hypothetical protein NC01_09925 [Streptococcus uberis]